MSRIEGSSPASMPVLAEPLTEVVPTTAEEVFAMQVARQLEEQQTASRQARRVASELQRHAEGGQIARMKEAALMDLFGGIAGAAATASQAVGNMAGAGQEQHDGDDERGVGSGFQAAFQGAQTAFGYVASEARTGAAHMEQVAARRAEIARAHHEDAQREERLAESAVSHLSATLEARRQAEQAASRG